MAFCMPELQRHIFSIGEGGGGGSPTRWWQIWVESKNIMSPSGRNSLRPRVHSHSGVVCLLFIVAVCLATNSNMNAKVLAKAAVVLTGTNVVLISSGVVVPKCGKVTQYAICTAIMAAHFHFIACAADSSDRIQCSSGFAFGLQFALLSFPMSEAHVEGDTTGTPQRGRGVQGQYVYWITMARPKQETLDRLGLKAPENYTREEFSQLVVKAHRECEVEVIETSCFLEPHTNGASIGQ